MQIIIENCVMEGWHPDGYPGNLAYSPELWEWMFDLGLYLNYDPSHLVWMGIDPVEALRPVRRPHPARPGQGHPGRPRGPQPLRLARAGGRPATTPGTSAGGATACPASARSTGCALVDALYEGGFDGVLSVEHEDPVWGGTEDKVEIGLQIAHRTLRPLLVA